MNDNTVDKIYHLMKARDSLRQARRNMKEAGCSWHDLAYSQVGFALARTNMKLLEYMKSNFDEYMEAKQRDEIPF